MPWLRRGTKSYYIRKVRDGGKLRSVHIGSGAVAEKAAADDRRLAEERRVLLGKRREEIQQQRDLLALVKTADTSARQLLDAALLAAGYHQHDRGTWRKRCLTRSRSSKR